MEKNSSIRGIIYSHHLLKLLITLAEIYASACSHIFFAAIEEYANLFIKCSFCNDTNLQWHEHSRDVGNAIPQFQFVLQFAN